MKKLLEVASLLAVSLSVQAGSAAGKVTGVSIENSSHLILFQLDSKMEDTPRCNERNLFAVDLRKARRRSLVQGFVGSEREPIYLIGRRLEHLYLAGWRGGREIH